MDDIKKEAALGSLSEEIKRLNKYISKFKKGEVTVTSSDGDKLTLSLDRTFFIQALQRKRSNLSAQVARVRSSK